MPPTRRRFIFLRLMEGTSGLPALQPPLRQRRRPFGGARKSSFLRPSEMTRIGAKRAAPRNAHEHRSCRSS
ncbi:Hypothetical protein NTJ_06896 [Nesidiocoris tenuis]|uniref:Uncharacterized protein n=1 Tax=Nesidiocoris tenuis TaxID=355587 RepID=A0ABN7AUF9_9HEMI|nr:Hypothetical protein NTJ_06896 [Nesidiocoris tenuis]